jgi:hypothetical protein
MIEMRVPRFGYYVVTTAALDAAMSKYLPASPSDLRAIVADRVGVDVSVYRDVVEAIAFLVMLADFDYNVDDSPLRSYS